MLIQFSALIFHVKVSNKSKDMSLRPKGGGKGFITCSRPI